MGALNENYTTAYLLSEKAKQTNHKTPVITRAQILL